MLPTTEKFKGFAEVEERPETVTWLDPPVETVGELKLQVAPPLQLKVMVLAMTVLGPKTEMVKLAVWEPIKTTLDRALEERVKTGLPVPETARPVVPLTALEVTATLPEVLPVALGVKLTATVQLWPTFNDAGTVGKLIPQLLVSAKPCEAVMLVMVTAWLPLLMRRAVWLGLVVPTVCAANVRFSGVKRRDPPVRTPFPVTVIACVPPALSLMEICSVWSPTELGSKVTWMLQLLDPPGKEVPQVLVCWKSPLEVMLLMFRAALPTLVSVTNTGLLGLCSG